jgi:hypothetical protein
MFNTASYFTECTRVVINSFAQITTELRIILNFLLQQLVSENFFRGKLTFCGRVLQPVTCVALAYSSTRENHDFLTKSFGEKEMLVVTSNKLTNNFEDLDYVVLGRIWAADLRLDKLFYFYKIWNRVDC